MGLIAYALLLDAVDLAAETTEVVGTREVLVSLTVIHAVAAWRFDQRLRSLEIETARMLEIIRARLEIEP